MSKFKQFYNRYNKIKETINDLKKIRVLIHHEQSFRLRNNNLNKIYSQSYLELIGVIVAYSTIEVLTKEIIFDFLKIKNTISEVIEFVKNKIDSNNIDIKSIYQILSNFGRLYKYLLKTNWNKLPKFSQYT